MHLPRNHHLISAPFEECPPCWLMVNRQRCGRALGTPWENLLKNPQRKKSSRYHRNGTSWRCCRFHGGTYNLNLILLLTELQYQEERKSLSSDGLWQGIALRNLDTDTSATNPAGVIRIGSTLPRPGNSLDQVYENKEKKKGFTTLNMMRQRPGITDRWEPNKRWPQFTTDSYGMGEEAWWVSWVKIMASRHMETYRARPPEIRMPVRKGTAQWKLYKSVSAHP